MIGSDSFFITFFGFIFFPYLFQNDSLIEKGLVKIGVDREGFFVRCKSFFIFIILFKSDAVFVPY